MLKTIHLSVTRCYLIKTSEGYLLIDCGCKNDKLSFLKQIKRLRIDISEIKALIITHHHNDHTGLLPFLVSVNPELKVIMSEKCAKILETGMHLHESAEGYSNKILEFLMKYYKSKPESDCFEPFFLRPQDVAITDDNFKLSEFGVLGKILFTPGHTSDSISIIYEKTAFVGDAVRNMLQFTGSPYMPILVTDINECKKSMEKLLKLGTVLICPGHGKPFPADLLRNTIT